MDDFELTSTNTTTMHPSQYNFYNKLSWKDYQIYIIIFITISTLLILSLLFIPISWNVYILRALLTVAFLAGVFFIPIFIKLKKLESRGTPYTSVGIDFNRSEIIFKNKNKEMYSYSPEKIQSLDIMEISKDASLWVINKNVHFKVPHQLHMPHLDNSPESVMAKRDNRFIIKIIAHLFVLNREIQISGCHWKITNLLNNENLQAVNDFDTEKMYLSNELIGSGIYKFAIALCTCMLLLSLYLNDLYLCLLSFFSTVYFLHILINNPAFFHNIKEFKETPIIKGLSESIKNINPNTAHMLTIPYSVAHPQSKKNKKEVEKVLILTKEENIMVYTASGKNLLE